MSLLAMVMLILHSPWSLADVPRITLEHPVRNAPKAMVDPSRWSESTWVNVGLVDRCAMIVRIDVIEKTANAE